MVVCDLFGGVEASKRIYTMHTTHLLHKVIGAGCQWMHAARLAALLVGVQALMQGRKLSVAGLGRALGGVTQAKHNIKRMDRLVGNAKLHSQRTGIYSAQAKVLIGTAVRPRIVVDWSDLNADRSAQLLRAAVPVGGRALTLYEEVHPLKHLGNRGVQVRFLQRLKAMLPPGCCPIIITDAGFRSPWFQAVASLGWDWLGRVRNRDMVQFDGEENWFSVKQLYGGARRRAEYLGRVRLVRSNPVRCAMYRVRRPKQGRIKRTCYGQRCQSAHSQKKARRQREPWLIVTSLPGGAHQVEKVIKLYALRMQIEEGFRDLKNARLGLSLCESRTKAIERLANLLLIAMLATLVLWLIGLAAQRQGLQYQFQANTTRHRAVLSLFYLGAQLVQHGTDWLTNSELRCSVAELQGISNQGLAT
jgi:hypothetical protein